MMTDEQVVDFAMSFAQKRGEWKSWDAAKIDQALVKCAKKGVPYCGPNTAKILATLHKIHDQNAAHLLEECLGKHPIMFAGVRPGDHLDQTQIDLDNGVAELIGSIAISMEILGC